MLFLILRVVVGADKPDATFFGYRRWLHQFADRIENDGGREKRAPFPFGAQLKKQPVPHYIPFRYAYSDQSCFGPLSSSETWLSTSRPKIPFSASINAYRPR